MIKKFNEYNNIDIEKSISINDNIYTLLPQYTGELEELIKEVTVYESTCTDDVISYIKYIWDSFRNKSVIENINDFNISGVDNIIRKFSSVSAKQKFDGFITRLTLSDKVVKEVNNILISSKVIIGSVNPIMNEEIKKYNYFKGGADDPDVIRSEEDKNTKSLIWIAIFVLVVFILSVFFNDPTIGVH
jgi:hypothetical protein